MLAPERSSDEERSLISSGRGDALTQREELVMNPWYKRLGAAVIGRGTARRMAAVAVGASALTLALTLVVVNTVRADPAPVTYYACVNTSTGSIQMTTATGSCKKGST